MNCIDTNQELLENVANEKYCGHDPFDGLNSSIFELAPAVKNSAFGLLWLQMHKRSYFNLRPVLGVPKARNPKGIAIFVLGLLVDFDRTQDTKHLEEAILLGDWLLTQQSDVSIWHYPCWGYHFDWKAKAFWVPKGTPNIITTVYVARALHALFEHTGLLRFLDPAIGAARFISESLFTWRGDEKYFAYIPGESAFVHNASLWGAAWVIKAGTIFSDKGSTDRALEVAQYSASHQREDGSWVYGALPHHQFIDGFHTGYNLEALASIRESLNIDGFDDCIDLGWNYYHENFFLADGTVKYYNRETYPLDMHSVAQAIITIVKLKKCDSHRDLIDRIAMNAINTLYDSKRKTFVYQRGRFFINRINYVRWTQAWGYYALTLFNHLPKREEPL